jgi:hypothetical protein
MQRWCMPIRRLTLFALTLFAGCGDSDSNRGPDGAVGRADAAQVGDAALSVDVVQNADAPGANDGRAGDVASNPDVAGWDASWADAASDGAAVDAAAPISNVSWNWDGNAWVANGSPPACPNPLHFAAPADLSKAVAVLYPGQVRGGNYKAHGGLRFADGTTAAVTVKAPMSGYLYRGVRYIEAGEVQYLFDIINPCGVMHRFDHLLTLSPRFQAIAETLPAAGASSMTTQLPPGQLVAEGEVIATAVGFKNTGNTSFDWGVYDLRTRNAASADATWLSAHPGEQAPYGLCWLDNFPTAERALLRALPPGDQAMGATSDYCR